MALEPVNSEVLRRYAYIPNVIGRHDEAIARPSRRSRSIRASGTTGSNSVSFISGRGAIQRRRRCSAS